MALDTLVYILMSHLAKSVEGGKPALQSLVQDSLERLYGEMNLGERGHDMVQIAQHTVDRILRT